MDVLLTTLLWRVVENDKSLSTTEIFLDQCPRVNGMDSNPTGHLLHSPGNNRDFFRSQHCPRSPRYSLSPVLALLNSIAEKLTSLRLELWRIAAFLVIFLFFGLNQVFANAPSFSLSAADEAFYVANRIIIGIAMLIVLWQLAKAVRSSSVSAQ